VADAVEGVVYRAESFLAVGQIDRAETLLRDELAQRPDDAVLLLALAKVFEARQQWREVVQTATAALEANPQSLNARMSIAWAAYRLRDFDLMKHHVDVVLAHRPEQPTALMYLALHASRDRSAAGKARIRELYRLSLQHSGGDPWYAVMAAKIEIWLANSAEARRIVDGALAVNPTDSELLQVKADLASTSIEESMDIVSGLLASSPADPSLRARFDTLVAARRRAVTSMLWLAPALVGLAIAFLGGPFRTGALVAIGAASFTVWGIRNASIQALPPAYQADLASKAGWRVAVRFGGRTAALLTFVGAILLAFEVVAGARLLVLAAGGWSVVRLASMRQERRLAVGADTDLAAVKPGTVADDGSGLGPAGRRLRDARWRAAILTPLVLIPFYIMGVLPPFALNEGDAARAATGLIAVIVAITALVGAAPWVRAPGRPGVTGWRLARLVVPFVLLANVSLTILLNLVIVTGSWMMGYPSLDDGERPTPTPAPATIPPGYFDDLESPVPIPTFTIPEFDLPSIPPLDPEG
jgi:tetratricopeptide (TPR) repeat protein